MGQRTGISDATGNTAWEYDARGQVIHESRHVLDGANDLGIYNTYGTYYSNDSVHQIGYPNQGAVTNAYDAGGAPQVGPGFYLTHPITPNQQSITWRMYYYAEGRRVALRVAKMPAPPNPYPAPPVASSADGNLFTRLGAFLNEVFGADTVSAAALAVEAPLGEVYFLLTDHLGSTTMTLGINGNVVSETRYGAWGNTRHSSGVIPTDRKYMGQIEESSINLMWYGSRWYDPALGRFISPDSIVPDKGNPQGLDRYAYVANNPISRIDTSGHCWGIASGIRDLPSYNTTCYNLDMALTIVQSDNATIVEKVGAIAYIGTEGLAHTALVVGSVACLSNVAICAAGAKTALGIGGAVTEASSIPVTGKAVIDFVSNQINKVSHIMQPKHAWDRLMTLTGDISKDYQAIQSYIQQAIDKGTVNQITTTAQGNPVFQYETTINGQVVIVKAVTLANGVIQVTDSWVKTK